MVKRLIPFLLGCLFLAAGCSEKSDLVPADDYDVYTDGTVVDYMTSSQGKGPTVLFMGDGFSSYDMTFGGKYEKSMKQAIDHFFSVEPFKSYRDYFNVKYVVAISKDGGVTSPEWTYSTKFSVKFTGVGSAMQVDDKQVIKYAQKALPGSDLSDVTVVMVANSPRYGGTTYMYKTGFTIALCPMSTRTEPLDFRGVLQHEGCGHGFGLLADEYVERDTAVSQTALADYREMTPLGYYANVDMTNNLDRIKWAHYFAYPDRYSQVAAYEGAFLFKYEAWRPELNSCMILNIPYFNAPSREAVVRRIKKLAGEEFVFADFMARDVIENQPPVSLSSSARASDPAQLLPPGCTWDDRLPAPVIVDRLP